ncbi:thioesterase superfamily protein [Mariprofundus micogutta]|uniref:Thioesterase superfamily protein n=1 Tax=Mariprofundus micogutta TaxID=1921010 RepID=A0A1L8CPF0_9PROT|nr:acyl-CoA thioesterase [Mariprofundus micogutta]GAV20764.1 thioesterase superfamily protein [Mariprofundus micogutta]
MHIFTMKQTRFTHAYTVSKTDLNQYGIMHGGRLLTLCDENAYCAAQKLTQHICLTRAVHRTQFHRAAHPGEEIIFSATVGLTGRTSIWVAVEVNSAVENQSIMDAVFVFAAINDNKQPQPVPDILAETDTEKLLQKRLQALRDQIQNIP